MDKASNILQEARTLADFSNLKESDTDYFRNNYPAFLPRAWWAFMMSPSGGEHPQKLWQAHQRTLQRAWQTKFPLEDSVRLIAAAAIPDKFVDESEFAPKYIASSAIVIPTSAAKMYGIGPDMWIEETQVWPYQRAVMFLSTEPWRAKFCIQCGVRFVAEKAAQKFCRDQCFHENRKRAKLSWWKEHGSVWRSSRNKKSKWSKKS